MGAVTSATDLCVPRAGYYNDIRTHRSLDKDAPVLAPFSGPETLIDTRSFADFIRHYVRVQVFGTHNGPAPHYDGRFLAHVTRFSARAFSRISE